MQKENNKKEKYFLRPALALLFLISMFACEKEEGQIVTQDISPRFSAGIKTKASDTIWHENDSIGIMMFKSGTDEILNDKFNCLYVTPDGDGLFSTEGSHVIIFPGDGSTVDFLSYYPYVEEQESFVFDLNVLDQTNLPAIDFMTSDRFESASKNSPNVLLHFHHRLTKLVFNFKLEDETKDASVESFFISGMLTQATYDMLTGELEHDDKSEKELEIPVDHESKDYPTATGIVLPREAGAGITFHIILDDGKEYEVDLVDDLDFETETMYIFNITLRDRETPPVISAAIIEPWKEVDDIDLESTPVAILPDAGTTTDFTSGEKIKVYDVYKKELLTTFTYNGGRSWTASPEVYWENIGDKTAEKVLLRAEYEKAAAVGENQMPEVLIAEVEVERFKAVHFDFKIVPAKIIIELKSEVDGDNTTQNDRAEFSIKELQNATITLPNYIIGYDLTQGVFTPGVDTESGDMGTITAKDVAVSSYTAREWVALVVPQDKKKDDVIVNVQIDNTYKVNATADIEFKRGEVCRLVINVTKTKVPSLSASYEKWGAEKPYENLPGSIEVNSGTTTNFETGDKMTLFYKKGSTVEKLRDFTYYESTGSWACNPMVYWENLVDPSPSKFEFYAVSTLKTATLGSNQMDDLMFADKEEEGTTKFDPIKLAFTKQTAKIHVKLKSDDGTFSNTELARAKVFLPQYKTGAHFDLNVYVAGNEAKDVQLDKVDNALQWTGLFQSQTIKGGDQVIKITIGSNDYYIKLASDITFDKAKAYTFEVNMAKVGVSFTASYSGWADADDKPIEIPTELE